MTAALKKERRDDGRGFLPPVYDYSDDVSDEHFKRIGELVDQKELQDAEVVDGPAW